MQKKITATRKQPLAIFDIDGTIFRSSLLIELVEACIDDGIFKPTAARAYERNKKRWLDRTGSYEAYLAGVIAAFRDNLSGLRYRDILRVSNDIIASRQNRVYRFTRDLVKNLRRDGYYLAAISHSPKEIVEPFARGLGFHKVYGITYGLDARKEKFNGKISHKDFILDKANVVRHILAKEPITLQMSVGVGDTESDVSFLRIVENPICFNPNRKLYAAAKRYDWNIVVERKDMIYFLRKAGERDRD